MQHLGFVNRNWHVHEILACLCQFHLSIIEYLKVALIHHLKIMSKLSQAHVNIS